MDNDKRVIFVKKKMTEFLLLYTSTCDNDAATRALIGNLCQSWLQTTTNNGTIAGYTFLMNDKNNTQHMIDNGKWAINVTVSFDDRADADIVVTNDPAPVAAKPSNSFDYAMQGV